MGSLCHIVDESASYINTDIKNPIGYHLKDKQQIAKIYFEKCANLLRYRVVNDNKDEKVQNIAVLSNIETFLKPKIDLRSSHRNFSRDYMTRDIFVIVCYFKVFALISILVPPCFALCLLYFILVHDFFAVFIQYKLSSITFCLRDLH